MIKIVVVSYNNQPPTSPMSALFGQEAKSFGRSEDNFFVLPDAKHMVSRKQASVRSDGVRHTITSLSHANPVVLNGREIDAGREYDLAVGDEISVGLYLLRAEAHLTAVSGKPVAEPILSTPAQPTARNDMPQPAADSAGARNGLQQSASPMHVANTGRLAEKSIGSEPVASPSVHLAGAAAVSLTPAVSTATETDTFDSQELMAAFLRGAGIPGVTLAPGLTPELMELIGKVLATSIQGTIDLSALRALIKREVRADVTMVVVKNNNPLKFFPDSQTVLTQMLRKKMPGFMGPVEAMEEAYEDLHSHQLGIVAGMRALIADMLARFDPALIENTQAPASFFGTAGRKAKLWDTFLDVYQKIDAEIKNDSQTQFGQVFLDAYEVEVERFKDGSQHG